MEAPEYRYIFSMEVMDYSGSQYVQLFNDEGERFFEIPAGRMNELEKSNSEEYERVFKSRLFKEYIMTLRVKVDQSMTSRVRCTVYRFEVLLLVSCFQVFESLLYRGFLVGRQLVAKLLELFLGLEYHAIGLIELVHALLLLLVSLGIGLSLSLHALDFLIAQAA